MRILADTNGDFTKAIQMDKQVPALGGLRSKRYTLLVKDNVVKKVFAEPEGADASCSLASNVLNYL